MRSLNELSIVSRTLRRFDLEPDDAFSLEKTDRGQVSMLILEDVLWPIVARKQRSGFEDIELDTVAAANKMINSILSNKNNRLDHRPQNIEISKTADKNRNQVVSKQGFDSSIIQTERSIALIMKLLLRFVLE